MSPILDNIYEYKNNYIARIYFRNKQYFKSFSIKRFGNDVAKQNAIDALSEFTAKIKSLVNQTPSKIVPGFERYKITAEGEVIGLSGIPLKPSIKNGYFVVGLYDDRGKVDTEYVHRIMAHAWLGMPEKEQIYVNHKDGIKKIIMYSILNG